MRFDKDACSAHRSGRMMSSRTFRSLRAAVGVLRRWRVRVRLLGDRAQRDVRVVTLGGRQWRHRRDADRRWRSRRRRRRRRTNGRAAFPVGRKFGGRWCDGVTVIVGNDFSGRSEHDQKNRQKYEAVEKAEDDQSGEDKEKIPEKMNKSFISYTSQNIYRFLMISVVNLKSGKTANLK